MKQTSQGYNIKCYEKHWYSNSLTNTETSGQDETRQFPLFCILFIALVVLQTKTIIFYKFYIINIAYMNLHNNHSTESQIFKLMTSRLLYTVSVCTTCGNYIKDAMTSM